MPAAGIPRLNPPTNSRSEAGRFSSCCETLPRRESRISLGGITMRSGFKLAFAVAACLYATVAAAPSFAQSSISPGPAYPQGYYAYPPDYYYNTRQGPNGTYDSLADFISDIRGRPC